MSENKGLGQEVAKLLAVFAALVGGEMIKTNTRPEGVEVLAIERDNWPNSPIVVRFATENGTETVWLNDFEIAES